MSISSFTTQPVIQQQPKLETEQLHCNAAMHVSNPQVEPVFIHPTNGSSLSYGGSSSTSVESMPAGAANIQQPPGMCSESNHSEHLLPSQKYSNGGTALVNMGDIPTVMQQQLGDRGALAAINIPYPAAVTSGAPTTLLTFQPAGRTFVAAPATGVWPVKIMQNASTMTEESELQAMPKIGPVHVPDKSKELGNHTCAEPQNGQIKGTAVESVKGNRHQINGGVDDDVDEEEEDDDEEEEDSGDTDDSKSDLHKEMLAECQQMHLEQQGTAMADYLSRLQPLQPLAMPFQHFLSYQTDEVMENGTSPSAVNNGNSKRSRGRLGEVRLITAADGSTLFSCPECQTVLPDRNQLDVHMQGHRAERRFVCNVCGACLKRKEHLDQHKRGHSDERPFVCSICLKGFKRNEHLTRHIVIHSGDKEHACSECGKRFSRKDHLHKHAQTHIARRMRNHSTSGSGVVEAVGPVPH
ncbi:gastrula zinc finger protein XlCGF48.2-like [Schistocerca americana]|uniref:gastrula zinc finger protein XlCGF48.2-like n=1 Tax=Schistocerca americana TaxID=7009 RepID=UPI001F4FEFA7|nr:gastrula zinc finger protein XlCGF48.2-like [Schistocerca americana]XP_049941275.1 gastrula zinc finger protein XlCGF48.2-like [Schistocerca serialis cubense]